MGQRVDTAMGSSAQCGSVGLWRKQQSRPQALDVSRLRSATAPWSALLFAPTVHGNDEYTVVKSVVTQRRGNDRTEAGSGPMAPRRACAKIRAYVMLIRQQAAGTYTPFGSRVRTRCRCHQPYWAVQN